MCLLPFVLGRAEAKDVTVVRRLTLRVNLWAKYIARILQCRNAHVLDTNMGIV